MRCQRQPLSVLGLEKRLSRSAANIYFAASAWLRRAGAFPLTGSFQACPPPEMVLFKRGHGGFLGHHISRLEARPWPEPKALIEALLHLSLRRGCQQDRQLLSALAALFCDDLLWGFFFRSWIQTSRCLTSQQPRKQRGTRPLLPGLSWQRRMPGLEIIPLPHPVRPGPRRPTLDCLLWD